MGGTAIAGGITFLAAAGDSGAYGENSRRISPQYPAASPNVVAVGGTSLTTSGDSYAARAHGEMARKAVARAAVAAA